MPRVLRLGAEFSAADRRAAGWGRPRRSGSSSRSGAARASRCARPSAARSGGWRSSPTQNARLALESDAVAGRAAAAAARRGARGAARGAQPREPAAADRVLRHLQHPGESPVGSMVVFQDACRRRRTTASSACAGSTARTTSRRWRRSSRAASRGCGTRRPRTYDESFAATPNLVVIDGGKGQLSAALAAMQALRPAARRGDLAREARRGGLRAGPPGSDRARPRTRRGSSCCSGSATRRTASRSASTGSGGTRGARVDLRHAAGRRPGPASRTAAPLRLGRALPRRLAGGARGRARLPAKTARKIYAQLHKAGRA